MSVLAIVLLCAFWFIVGFAVGVVAMASGDDEDLEFDREARP